MLIVHHLERSRSLRLVWLLEELGLPYRITAHQRDPKTQLAGPELRALHPMGTAPLLEDDGRVYAETGAIFDHLLEGRDTALMPATGPARDQVRYWLHHAEGSAMPPLVMTLVFDTAAQRAPALIRPIARKIAQATKAAYHGPLLERMMAFWEDELAKTGWFGPHFCAGDIIMSFPVEGAMTRATPGPATRDWLARIHARPAYQRAVDGCREALGTGSV